MSKVSDTKWLQPPVLQKLSKITHSFVEVVRPGQVRHRLIQKQSLTAYQIRISSWTKQGMDDAERLISVASHQVHPGRVLLVHSDDLCLASSSKFRTPVCPCRLPTRWRVTRARTSFLRVVPLPLATTIPLDHRVYRSFSGAPLKLFVA